MEVCREYQVPMFAHGGSEENDHPFYFEELARAFPDVTVILDEKAAAQIDLQTHLFVAGN